MPKAPWPKTAPPAAAAPWQMGLPMKAAPSLVARDHTTTVSSTVPTGLVTTPVCTAAGGITSSVMLSSGVSMQAPPHQALPDSALVASPSPPLFAADVGATRHEAIGFGSGACLDDEVIFASSLLTMIMSGPSVPPLPPSGCYGTVNISS